MPLISITGMRASSAISSSGSSTALAPKGFAVSEKSFASVRVRAMPTVTGSLAVSLIRSRRSRAAAEAERRAGEHLVPLEVALRVDTLRALLHRVPDRLAGLDPLRLHLVALGDDARPLVPEDGERRHRKVRIPHPLRAGVVAVAIDMA